MRTDHTDNLFLLRINTLCVLKQHGGECAQVVEKTFLLFSPAPYLSALYRIFYVINEMSYFSIKCFLFHVQQFSALCISKLFLFTELD